MISEFFGFDGYGRVPEGYLSWQHLTFVTLLMIAMTILAVCFGLRNKGRTEAERNRVLMVAALLADGMEILKFLLIGFLGGGWESAVLNTAPLYVCSIQLITLPMAAFSRGRFREAALDFVCIFGLLGAVLGTYGAGNNYACYPVLSYDNVHSGISHAISGFASLYILISGMATMKKRNIWIACSIIAGFGVAAGIANLLTDRNFMFLVRGDGTPYDLVYNLVGGSPVLYPAGVMALFFLYILLFHGAYRFFRRRNA